MIAARVVPRLALRGHPRFGGAAAGAGAGAVIGAGSVLLAVAANRWGDWSDLLTSWAPYAALAVGALGLLLAQVAFQTGDLGAPLAALSIVEPVVAVVLAVSVLHEDLPTSAAKVAMVIAGTVLSVAGVLALCRPDSRSDERDPVGVHV